MSRVGVVSEYGGSHAQVCGRERPTRGKARVKGGNGTSHSGKRGGASFCASSEERGYVSLFPNMAYNSVNYAVKELKMHNL